MRLIIAGGRDYQLTTEDYAKLDEIHAKHHVTEELCGGASGADECGRKWADENEIVVRYFPADWKSYGKAAGPMRNRQMAQNADAVALFPGNRGTTNMHSEAVAAGLVIFDFRS